MQTLHLTPLDGFRVIARTRRSQAATMELSPGSSTGGATNRHATSDQWMYVIAGTGRATVGGRSVKLEPGMLLLIEAGETHEIINSGKVPLQTLNVYAPPAY